MTLDAMTGKSMPFALITLNDATGKRVAFAVSDEHGRFILSGEKGVPYDVIAYTPANVSPQRTSRLHLSGLLGAGWITSKIRI